VAAPLSCGISGLRSGFIAGLAIELRDDSFERREAEADFPEERWIVRDEVEAWMPRPERPQLPDGTDQRPSSCRHRDHR